MIKKYVGVGLLAFGLLFFVSSAAPAYAASLTAQQISAIIGLLQSFGADQTTINNVSTALGGAPSSSVSCNTFSDVTYGSFDTRAGGRVSQLQTFLGISSNTAGFGTYGPKTLALWKSKCGTTQSVKACRIDFPEGANIRSSAQSTSNECKSYCDMHGTTDAEANGGDVVCKFQGVHVASYSAKNCRIDYPEGANIRGSYQISSSACKTYCDANGSADAAANGGAAVCKYKGMEIASYKRSPSTQELKNGWKTMTAEALGIRFAYPSDATVTPVAQRTTTDGISISEVVVIPSGIDATRVRFFKTNGSLDQVKNIRPGVTQITTSEFVNTTTLGRSSLLRVDHYRYNDCTDETILIQNNNVVYGSYISVCPTHVSGHDQIRRDIAKSLEIL